MIKILALGDLHGSPIAPELSRIMDLSEPDFILQVGDYSCYNVSWPFPLYFITGNHEVMNGYKAPIDKIKAGKYILPNNNNMLTAGLQNIMGINVVALPSVPMPGAAPGPALFTPEDYDACMTVKEPVDVFVSHGCGFPFWVYIGNQRKQVEDQAVTKLLKHLNPKYAISGHNHLYEKIEQDGIQLIRLGCNRPDAYHLLIFDA